MLLRADPRATVSARRVAPRRHLLGCAVEHPDDEQEEHGSEGGFAETDGAHRADADPCLDDEPWEGTPACVPFTDPSCGEFLGHAAGELVEDLPGVAFHALDGTDTPVAVQMPSVETPPVRSTRPGAEG